MSWPFSIRHHYADRYPELYNTYHIGPALRRLPNLRKSRNVPAKKLFQGEAVRIASLTLAEAHAVDVVDELLLVAVVTGVACELVTLVVDHLQGHGLGFLAVSMGGCNDLLGHISGSVVGILLPVARGLQEAGQFTLRIVGVAVLHDLASLRAHLARDVAILVVAVREGDLTRTASSLRKQIPHAVIAV